MPSQADWTRNRHGSATVSSDAGLACVEGAASVAPPLRPVEPVLIKVVVPVRPEEAVPDVAQPGQDGREGRAVRVVQPVDEADVDGDVRVGGDDVVYRLRGRGRGGAEEGPVRGWAEGAGLWGRCRPACCEAPMQTNLTRSLKSAVDPHALRMSMAAMAVAPESGHLLTGGGGGATS